MKRFDLDNSCQDYEIDTICSETADYVSLRSTERFKENLIDSPIIESMMACPTALDPSRHSSLVWVNMCTYYHHSSMVMDWRENRGNQHSDYW